MPGSIVKIIPSHRTASEVATRYGGSWTSVPMACPAPCRQAPVSGERGLDDRPLHRVDPARRRARPGGGDGRVVGLLDHVPVAAELGADVRADDVARLQHASARAA